MGWASAHIGKLRAGETVAFRPRGHSMKGRIESGQLCTVAPVDVSTLKVGDIVLCKVGGNEYLHIVKANVMLRERMAVGLVLLPISYLVYPEHTDRTCHTDKRPEINKQMLEPSRRVE